MEIFKRKLERVHYKSPNSLDESHFSGANEKDSIENESVWCSRFLMYGTYVNFTQKKIYLWALFIGIAIGENVNLDTFNIVTAFYVDLKPH